VKKDAPEYRSPGWYPDPKAPGGTRWWDGSEWSDHKKSATAEDVAPHPAQVPIVDEAVTSDPPVTPTAAPAAPPAQRPLASGGRVNAGLGFRAISFGAVSVVFLFFPTPFSSTWVIQVLTGGFAVVAGVVAVFTSRRLGRSVVPGAVAIVLGAVGLVGLAVITVAGAAQVHDSAHSAAPIATPSSLPSASSTRVARERATESQQIEQLANGILTARGGAANFPATLHLDATGKQILDPSGAVVGTVPVGEEFSYNVSTGGKSYVITLDELADGVGVRLDTSNSQLTYY
jgi:hypothetical protein